MKDVIHLRLTQYFFVAIIINNIHIQRTEISWVWLIDQKVKIKLIVIFPFFSSFYPKTKFRKFIHRDQSWRSETPGRFLLLLYACRFRVASLFHYSRAK